MKFTADTRTLKSACDTAKRAVSGKCNIPALDGLLLRFDNADGRETLRIAGYDLEVCIETGIACDVDGDDSLSVVVYEPGECVLDASVLCSILGKLSGDIVSIEVDKRLRAKLSCGDSEYKLTAMPADDFPELPSAKGDAPAITIPTAELQRMIRGTVFAASTCTETKPIHTGVLFEHDGTTLTLAAIDGYRAAVRKTDQAERTGEQAHFVVPQKALRELAGMKTAAEQVMIFQHKRHITFIVGDVQITSRLLDGAFMDYSAAIPQNWDVELTVDRLDLLAAIERVSLVNTEKVRAATRMTLCPNEGAIMLTCETGVGEARELVSVDGCTKALQIGFNHRLLADAIAACDDDTVKLRVNRATQPVIIVPEEGDRYLYLVLPVRLGKD